MILELVTLAAALGALVASALTLRTVLRLEQSTKTLRALVAEMTGRADTELLAQYLTPKAGGLHLPDGFESRYRSDDDEPV